jgi:hypothetical protein
MDWPVDDPQTDSLSIRPDNQPPEYRFSAWPSLLPFQGLLQYVCTIFNFRCYHNTSANFSYMTPRLFRHRFAMFQLYYQARDTANAIYWGRSILTMPEKVPSAKSKAIKVQAAQILAGLQ